MVFLSLTSQLLMGRREQKQRSLNVAARVVLPAPTPPTRTQAPTFSFSFQDEKAGGDSGLGPVTLTEIETGPRNSFFQRGANLDTFFSTFESSGFFISTPLGL